MFRKVTDYILDKSFRFSYGNNKFSVSNYKSVVSSDNDLVIISYLDKLLKIRGNNLEIVKLLDDELMIDGVILEIELG